LALRERVIRKREVLLQLRYAMYAAVEEGRLSARKRRLKKKGILAGRERGERL